MFQVQDGKIINNSKRISNYNYNVSIPRWYDYKNNPGFLIRTGIEVSIPRWYDYKPTTYPSPKFTFVSIPRWYDYKKKLQQKGNLHLCFNSKMVRL